jgi:small subunit ribosomal protein S21
MSYEFGSKSRNYFPEEKSGICVVRRKDETYDDLVKRFRKKFSKSGIVKELRDRTYYEKPSAKKRRKRKQSIKGIEKDQLKLEDLNSKFGKKGD